MQELYEGIELDDEQTEWICRGLLDLAAVDGVHESEIELVRDFYSASGERSADIAALQAKGFDIGEASKHLLAGGDKVVEAFIVSCYLLIYADGEHSDAERKRIGQFAEGLGIDAERLEGLHVKARLYLLQILANNLRNKDVVRQVGAEMGLADDQIDQVGG